MVVARTATYKKEDKNKKCDNPPASLSLSSHSLLIARMHVIHFVFPLIIATPNDEHLPHAANTLKLLYIAVEDKPPEWFAEISKTSRDG